MVLTKKQLLSIAGVAAAIVAVSFAAPDNAHAWLFDWDKFKQPGRGAPEVDPSTISSIVALALGGFAVLGDKPRRR